MIANGPNNALAEVALALAMGFFSIMVLAMVSMGADVAVADLSAVAVKKGLQVSLPVTPGQNGSQSSAHPTEPTSPGSILIHYRGRFLNAQFEDVAPETWRPEGQGVLAIEPTLSMGEALQLRERVHGSNISVTTLDERWLLALKETMK